MSERVSIPPSIIRDVDDPKKPYKDFDLLEWLYIEKELSQGTIADLLGCAQTTIANYIRKSPYDSRSAVEAARVRNKYNVKMHLDKEGYETFKPGSRTVRHARLLATLDWSLEEMKGKHVHHKIEIPWADWPSNITLRNPDEHLSEHHSKIDMDTRIEIYQRYNNEEGTTLRSLASEYAICNTAIHNSNKIVERKMASANLNGGDQ